MSTKKLKIAILGLGKIGKIVAANLVKGNRPVIVAGRKLDDAKSLAEKLGSLATAAEIPAAIKDADIVVLAMMFDSLKDMISQYALELQGKIIIDPSNPIAPDGSGGFKKIIGANESAGQLIAALLPTDAILVKALGTFSAGSLLNASRRKPDAAVLFFASDNTSINGQIEELIIDSGFDPLYVGGIDQSGRIEVFGDLHEFGGLRKPVSLVEAKKLNLTSAGSDSHII